MEDIIVSMIRFLLICPTSALEKIFNPQNMLYINLRLKIVSALNLNKFPKNLIIEIVHIFSRPIHDYSNGTYENKKGEHSWDLLHSAATR